MLCTVLLRNDPWYRVAHNTGKPRKSINQVTCVIFSHEIKYRNIHHEDKFGVFDQTSRAQGCAVGTSDMTHEACSQKQTNEQVNLLKLYPDLFRNYSQFKKPCGIAGIHCGRKDSLYPIIDYILPEFTLCACLEGHVISLHGSKSYISQLSFVSCLFAET